MEKVIHEITGRTEIYKFVDIDGVLWLITGKRKGQRLMQKVNREEFRRYLRAERMRGTARI
jgi:hypothetical protein